MSLEKRKHPRFPLVLTIGWPGVPFPLRDRTDNLSASGMLIRTDLTFDPGERGALVVSFASLGRSLEIEIEVVRVRPGRAGELGAVAVRVPADRPADRRRLEQFFAEAELASRTEATRVLLVEDNALVARSLGSALRRVAEDEGLGPFAVDIAADGREALAKLLSPRPFHLVVTDIHLPVMDGVALLESMRGEPRLRDLPVVVVSAAEEAEFERARLAGANALLRKPARYQDIVQSVRAVLGVWPAAPVPGPPPAAGGEGGSMWDSPGGVAHPRGGFPFDPGGSRGAE